MSEQERFVDRAASRHERNVWPTPGRGTTCDGGSSPRPFFSWQNAIFLDHHSWLHWPTRDDLAHLAETGATVAHCPTVFSRSGILLEDFGRYRAAGVNLGIGTDTFPHN